MKKYTVSYYMKGEKSLQFKNFDTQEQAQEFMMALNENPLCEAFKLSIPKIETLNKVYSPQKNDAVLWHNIPCRFISVDDNGECKLKQISLSKKFGKIFTGVKLSELKPF